MNFEQLRKDAMYRVVKGNDTFPAGELVWTVSMIGSPNLKSLQGGTSLGSGDIQEGVCGLEFAPEPNWDIQTKHGPGGYSRPIC